VPLDLASAFLVHRHLLRRQASRAVRAAPLAALRASPLHLTLHAPLQHPATLAPVSQLTAHDVGVRHPTPAEVATQTAKASVTEAERILAGILAKQEAWTIAHPRPDVHAQPSIIAAWLKAGGLSPRAAFPEWGWQVIRKTTLPLGALGIADPFGGGQHLEPGEAVAVVQLGPSDGVVWYDHPSGAWSYYHHWGQGFAQVLASIAQTVSDAVSHAAQLLGEALKAAQTAASLVPGLGQIVNGVVSAAEAALDALGGMSGLQIALDTAYHAALAAVPGAEALAPMLDPLVGTLEKVAGGQSITRAALGQAVAQVPDTPNVGGLSPRSVASSLAGWLASKVGLG
jgi:hypothetical protein